MIYGVIYKITNLINNKKYIGQTINKFPEKRIKLHFKIYKDRKDIVALSVKKYGIENFKYEIICSAKNKEDLDWLEMHFIKYYNCISPNGYNLTLGGKSIGKHTEETIRKISKAHKGIPKTEQHKKSMSKSRKGFDSENRKNARSKNKRILGKKIIAFNIETKVEVCFYCIQDCANLLKLQAQNVSECLHNKNGRIQSGGWKFKLI